MRFELNLVDTMQTLLCGPAMRRSLRKSWIPLLLSAATVGIICAPASAQVAVPKYQSPLDAPTPQMPTLPAPPSITPDATVVEYPIARVNDQIIDKSDYERGQQALIDEAQHNNASATDIEQQQKDLLRDLIDQQLLLSRGKEMDIDANAELIRRLDEIRKQYHFDTMDQLEKAVRQSGISYEDFKSNITNSIITQEVVREEVGRKLSLSTKQENAYYEAHKQDFTEPEQEKLSEILIPTPDDATDAQVAQAKTKAEMVSTKLKSGEKFDALAKQYSGGPTADQGGALGEPFKRGEGKLAKVIEDQVFALNADEVTPPIRTRQGFILLKVTEHTQAGIQPLSAVEQQVQQAVYEEAIKPAYRTYLTSLREKAFIQIQAGFVDSGASSKEVKAVFAASIPPPLKKHQKKARLVETREEAPAKTQAPGTPAAASGNATAASTPEHVSSTRVASSKKRKKVRREKIRFGQAPPETLPPAQEESLTAGTNEGTGATQSSLTTSGMTSEPNDQTAMTSSDADPFTTKATPHEKTRFSDRAPVEAKAKDAAKVTKAQEKAAETPAPLTAQETAKEQMRRSALGLGEDTATKKKKTKVKDAPKERMQEQAPTPPAPKPDATPIPPRSVRENGEPVVTPPPDPSTLPTVTAPTP